jgi:hypothetical protein
VIAKEEIVQALHDENARLKEDLASATATISDRSEQLKQAKSDLQLLDKLKEQITVTLKQEQ